MYLFVQIIYLMCVKVAKNSQNMAQTLYIMHFYNIYLS